MEPNGARCVCVEIHCEPGRFRPEPGRFRPSLKERKINNTIGKNKSTPKKMKNCNILTFAAIGAAALLAFSSCGKMQQAMGSEQAPQIGVMTVEQGNSTLNSAYSATIKGKTDIEVRPLVSGFITKVCVDEGQAV